MKEKGVSAMLKLEKISKSFDGVSILKDISLEIEKGEIVSILGPSGSGKTTLLNLILGLTQTDSGRIIFEGKDLTDVPMEERGFNIVFQDYALFPHLNAYKNITYGLRNKPDISTGEEVEELISLLGLEEHLDKKIDQLSGGQKQRVALARTMVMKPKILLLDEPSRGIDIGAKTEVFEIIHELAEKGLSIIVISSELKEIMAIADRICVLSNGKKTGELTGDEITEDTLVRTSYAGLGTGRNA